MGRELCLRGNSAKPCLSDPLGGFAHGAFLKSPFLFSGKSENSRAEPNVIPACQLVLDGGGARVVLDSLDHRTHAIGALRRQMRRKAEALEQARGINGKDP